VVLKGDNERAGSTQRLKRWGVTQDNGELFIRLGRRIVENRDLNTLPPAAWD
jgi:hypothetical protein